MGIEKTGIAKHMNMHVGGAMITKFLLSLYTKLKKSRTHDKKIHIEEKNFDMHISMWQELIMEMGNSSAF